MTRYKAYLLDIPEPLYENSNVAPKTKQTRLKSWPIIIELEFSMLSFFSKSDCDLSQ
jgi:hypothetical protein